MDDWTEGYDEWAQNDAMEQVIFDMLDSEVTLIDEGEWIK